MIKKCHLVLLTCTLLFLQPVFADSFKIPAEESFVALNIPSDWKSEPFDGGVEAVSEDGEVYIAAEATETKSVEAAMEEAFAYLKKKGVEVDADTAKQSEAKLNGFDVVNVAWDGKDEDGVCRVSLSVIAISEDKGLLLTYWASPDGEKANLKALDAIANSIKATE